MSQQGRSVIAHIDAVINDEVARGQKQYAEAQRRYSSAKTPRQRQRAQKRLNRAFGHLNAFLVDAA